MQGKVGTAQSCSNMCPPHSSSVRAGSGLTGRPLCCRPTSRLPSHGTPASSNRQPPHKLCRTSIWLLAWRLWAMRCASNLRHALITAYTQGKDEVVATLECARARGKGGGGKWDHRLDGCNVKRPGPKQAVSAVLLSWAGAWLQAQFIQGAGQVSNNTFILVARIPGYFYFDSTSMVCTIQVFSLTLSYSLLQELAREIVASHTRTCARRDKGVVSQCGLQAPKWLEAHKKGIV